MKPDHPIQAEPTPIAIIGVGKIARDQHIPALLQSQKFRLAAFVDPVPVAVREAAKIPSYASLASMMAALPDLKAVVICTPPQVRYEQAVSAIHAGLHVMLEKPPASTVSASMALKTYAHQANVSVYATWHSRHARGVAKAKAWLSGKSVRSVTIEWKEDVRRWHPGQDWLFEAGGLGVFDPGINALSILTEILPDAVMVEKADLYVPSNREAPIAVELTGRIGQGVKLDVVFDFRKTGDQIWQIDIQTDGGRLRLAEGGAVLIIDDAVQALPSSGEYPELYDNFAALIAGRTSQMDLAPMQLIADAFLIGRRHHVDPFFY